MRSIGRCSTMLVTEDFQSIPYTPHFSLVQRILMARDVLKARLREGLPIDMFYSVHRAIERLEARLER